MNPDLIRTVLKSDILRESAFYQDSLQEGLEEGREKGLQQGESSLLRKLLMKWFGELSEAIEVRLSQAAVSDLELWAEHFWEARTLSKVFR